jgi:hypothetical protein
VADPFSTNIGLALPLRGSDVGVWDLPVNADFNAFDGYLGGVQTVSASSAPILLTSPAGFVPTPGGGPTQAQNAVLRFTGALTSAVQVTLPLPGYNIIENLTTGAFILQFRAIAAGQVICVDQGEIQHIYNDGTNVRFVNLGRIGSYLDISDATVPAWILNCSVPPYLDCNGSTFSAVTYPYLNVKLGGNTLPDFRGRSAFYLNEGTNRVTAGGAGLDGNTRFAATSNNGISLPVSAIPAGVPSSGTNTINVASTDSLNVQGPPAASVQSGAVAAFAFASATRQVLSTGSNNISVQSTNGAQTIVPMLAPGIVGGLRLIRAA